MFIRYRNHRHRIPNVSPEFIFREAFVLNDVRDTLQEAYILGAYTGIYGMLYLLQ